MGVGHTPVESSEVGGMELTQREQLPVEQRETSDFRHVPVPEVRRRAPRSSTRVSTRLSKDEGDVSSCQKETKLTRKQENFNSDFDEDYPLFVLCLYSVSSLPNTRSRQGWSLGSTVLTGNPSEGLRDPHPGGTRVQNSRHFHSTDLLFTVSTGRPSP